MLIACKEQSVVTYSRNSSGAQIVNDFDSNTSESEFENEEEQNSGTIQAVRVTKISQKSNDLECKKAIVVEDLSSFDDVTCSMDSRQSFVRDHEIMN